MRYEQCSGGAKDVADIPLLEVLVQAFRKAVPFQTHLYLSGPVLQLDEAGLAHDTFHHHPARDTHAHRFFAQVSVLVITVALM